MSGSSIAQWRSYNISPEAAQEYAELGVKPDEAYQWQAIGFTDIDNVEDWHSNKLSPQEAKEWQQAGFDVDDAVDERERGLKPINSKKRYQEPDRE